MWTDPRYQSRRAFLANTAFGVGALALADLMRAEGLLADTTKKPGENLPLNLNARAPHFAPQGDGHDLPVHARGPVARRPVRPQARAEPITRHRLRRRGGLQLRQPGQQEALRLPLEVRPPRPVRHRGLRAAARDRPDRGRPLRGPVDAHRAQRARGLDSLFPRRAAGHRGTAHDGKLARLRPGQRIAVAAVVHGSCRPRRTPRGRHDQLVERVHAAALPGDGAPPAGAADPQPRPAPAACGAAPAAEPRPPRPAQSPAPRRSIRANPTWNRGSTASSWPRPCRRPPRKRSTSPASPRTSGGSTDSTRTRPASTARAA